MQLPCRRLVRCLKFELLSDNCLHPLFSQLDTTHLVLTVQLVLLHLPPLCAQMLHRRVTRNFGSLLHALPRKCLPPPSQRTQSFVLLAWVMHTWVIAPWTAVLKRHVGKKQACRAERWSLRRENKRWVLSTGSNALPERGRSPSPICLPEVILSMSPVYPRLTEYNDCRKLLPNENEINSRHA